MTVRTLPDVERLVADYLRSHTDVAALVAARVSTELPAKPVYPALTLTRIGGTPSLAGFLDVAVIEFTCWAKSKAVAHQLARTVESAALQLPGVHALGVVTNVIELAPGLKWNPDPEAALPRYQFVLEVYVHPVIV